MRLFILFIPFLLIYSTTSYSQSKNLVKDLSSQQRKQIKKKIKGMSTEDKMKSFVILEEEYVAGFENSIGGLLLDSPEFIEPNASPVSSELIRIINLTQVDTYHNLPFPSSDTRNQANKSLPSWFQSALGANYFVDLDSFDLQNLYYGLDSIGIYTIATPYQSLDSLLSATIKHDMIYTPLTPEIVFKHMSEIKVKSSHKKALNEKLTSKLYYELKKTDLHRPRASKDDVMQWIWLTYARANNLSITNGIVPIINLDSINLCSFTFRSIQFDKFSEVLGRYTTMPSYTSNQTTRGYLARLAAYDLVIIPSSKLSELEIEFVETLATKTRVLVVNFDLEVPDIRNEVNISIVSVPENNWLSQTIAAQYIFGASLENEHIQRLQYGIPELVNMNPSILKTIDKVVEEAILEQAMPGCQILVAKNSVVIFDEAYGYQTYDSINKVSSTTIYDLASITKVLATTQGIMYLLEDNSITLDAPLSDYLEYLDNTNKKDITIRQIMAHQAGLYPYYPFWKLAKQELKLEKGIYNDVQVGKSLWVNSSVEDSILSWAATSDLLAERIDTITHEQYFYSDIGFYLLKDLIEQQTGLDFDQFLNAQFYRPLGSSLVFNPTCSYPIQKLAPTENDNLLRHEIVRGFVHDRNAALMGGVAGQAGLFGNANDVAIMLQLQLNGGWYGGRKYFNSATIKQFTSRQYDNNRRGLGWDMPGSEPDGPVSLLAADDTFGHTGFTGGSIWVDPKESLIFVFLSNRIYPTVDNTKLIDMNIRTRIQDIVYRAIMKE